MVGISSLVRGAAESFAAKRGIDGIGRWSGRKSLAVLVAGCALTWGLVIVPFLIWG